MGRNFSIASKKHQNDFDVLVIVRKRLKNGIAISFLELSTVAPKPREQVNRRSAAGGGYSEAVKRSARIVSSESEDRIRKTQEGEAFRVSLPLLASEWTLLHSDFSLQKNHSYALSFLLFPTKRTALAFCGSPTLDLSLG